MRGAQELSKAENTFVSFSCVQADERLQVENEMSDISVSGLEEVQNFCYLGDVIQKDGSCDNAVVGRVQKGWAKFKEISGILCNRRISLKLKGILYRICVRTVMTYGSETWPMKKENEDNLTRAERRMIRMICGVTLSKRQRSEVLQEMIGLP